MNFGSRIADCRLHSVADSSIADWRLLLIPLTLLALTGCGDKQHTEKDARLDNIAQTELDSAVPRTVPAPRSNAAASSGLAIKRPQSPEQIAAAYGGVGTQVVAPQPMPNHSNQKNLYAPDKDGSVTYEPGWDVPVTREWRHIVIHHSASVNGSAAAFDRAHVQRGWEGLGYHFVIGNGSLTGDGQVEVGFRWSQQKDGAHAGNKEYNEAGIGICLVGDFENGAYPSAAQVASLRRLVRYLQVKTGVPTWEVIGHCNVPGKSTLCPGHNFDLQAFRESLGKGAIGVPMRMANDSGYTPSRPARQVRSSSSRSTGSSAAIP
ncbi:MAG TPA: peptidoglycan recognition family protein [Planctomycetota bacterium]|jgi:hypothetical protein